MKLTAYTQVSFTVNAELTEGEARALNALAGYGVEEFLTVFRRPARRAWPTRSLNREWNE